MNNVLAILTKLISVIMSFFFMLTGGNPDKTELKITGTPNTSDTVIEYEITNYTGRTVTADKYFFIEQKTADGWILLETAEGFATEEIAILIPNCGSTSLLIDLTAAYGHTPEAGEYRLTVPCIEKSTVFYIV